jgi:hypothetical protein
MIPRILLSLLLADVPTPLPATVQIHDLARMTWRQAQHLDGLFVRVVFRVASLETDVEGCVLAYGASAAGVAATIRFAKDQSPEVIGIGDRLTVEGLLVTQESPSFAIDGVRFPAVNTVEIRGARLSRP